jgi:hypothetical protein
MWKKIDSTELLPSFYLILLVKCKTVWFRQKFYSEDGQVHTDWLICKLTAEWMNGNNRERCWRKGEGRGLWRSVSDMQTDSALLPHQFRFVLLYSALLWKRNVIPAT